MTKTLDWASEYCSTLGTGNLILTGGRAGYSRFSAQLQNGDDVWYYLADGLNKETGHGVFNGVNQITRVPDTTLINGLIDAEPTTPINLTGNAIVSCGVSATNFDGKEPSLGIPAEDGYVMQKNLDGTTSWSSPDTLGQLGPQGIEGPEGPAGSDAASVNFLGYDESAVITQKISAAVGDSWISIDNGFDSDGVVVSENDTLRSSDTATPSHWVNIGIIAGKPGIQGIQGIQGVQGIGSQGPQGIQGNEGAEGIQGAAGLGLNILGSNTVSAIVAGVANVTGDGWIATDSGTDSNGLAVAIGDVLRATNILTPTNWVNIGTMVGAQGPQGIPGATGSDGLNGDSGSDGAQGIQGPDGLQGVEGPTGPQGVAGLGINLLGRRTVASIVALTANAVGDAWSATDTGTDSESSPVAIEDVLRATDTAAPSTWVNIGAIKGETGETGLTGPTGADGVDGAVGQDGAQGPQGIQGLPGIEGPEGPEGPAGSDATVDVIDNLNSTSSTSVLSAGQGKVLNDNKVANGRVLTDVPANALFTDTLTVVENTLTSTSTTKALASAQGKALNDNKYPKAGGTISGAVLVNSTLDVSGQITGQVNIVAYSDERLKKNLEIIEDALEKVQRLNGYTFDRVDMNVPRQTGVIAQELIEVLPEAVTKGQGGVLAVAYGNVIGLLIEAIKELNERVDKL